MKERNNQRSLSGLAALLLLGIFGAGMLFVLLTGTQVYRMMAQRDGLAHDSRIRSQYVATKVRQAPSAEAIGVERFGQGDALVIRQQVQAEPYLTRIYCCDGWLMELFSAKKDSFTPGDGERIVPAECMELEREDDLLRITFVCGGEEQLLCVYLPGAEEGQG